MRVVWFGSPPDARTADPARTGCWMEGEPGEAQAAARLAGVAGFGGCFGVSKSLFPRGRIAADAL